MRLATGLTLGVLGLTATGAVAQPLISEAFTEEAAASSTLVVSPMWQKILLTPGESWSGSIRVQNPATATQDLKYTVSVGSFSEKAGANSVDDYGTVDVQSVSDYNQIMEWITLGKTSGELGVNESEEVSFTINVPTDAPGGGQYASIIIKDDSDKDQSGGDVMIESDTQIASVLYAEVAGDTREEGQILDNSVPTFSTTNHLEVSSMVENDGNVHGDATYTLQVWPMGSDEEICTNEEEPKNILIMPGTKKYYVQSCDVAPVGIYRVKQTIKLFGETSAIERTVFVIPIWLIVIVIIAIAVIIYLIVRARKSRK